MTYNAPEIFSTLIMADLPKILTASLQPDTRKEAERALTSISNQPGFHYNSFSIHRRIARLG